MLAIGKRLELLIKELGENKNSFSKKIGLSNNVTIGRIINEDRSPSGDTLTRILQTFGNVNANWLLTGIGSMFMDQSTGADNAQSVVNEPVPHIGLSALTL